MLALVTTCKGRLSHLKESLPFFVSQFPRVVVVDWDCPDGTTEWLLHGGWGINNPLCHRASVLSYVNEPVFHKTAALNEGASYAIERGATRLVFADADMIIPDTLGRYLEDVAEQDMVLTGPHHAKIGFLSVSVERFKQVNGYDELYQGWGYEDLDMRLRLYCDASCTPRWLPQDAFRSIPHKTAERVRFQDGSIQESAARNRKLYQEALRKRLQYWSQDLKDCLPYQ